MNENFIDLAGIRLFKTGSWLAAEKPGARLAILNGDRL
jgi:hypothetical protein